jgi:pimeloyl-ACP methyl ester carboxylesterase
MATPIMRPAITRDHSLADLEAFFQPLNLNEAIVLGNSFGGVNPHQFGARHPGKGRGLIIWAPKQMTI